MSWVYTSIYICLCVNTQHYASIIIYSPCLETVDTSCVVVYGRHALNDESEGVLETGLGSEIVSERTAHNSVMTFIFLFWVRDEGGRGLQFGVSIGCFAMVNHMDGCNHVCRKT